MQKWLAVAHRIDRMNDSVYAMIRWLTLAMIAVGSINALLRYATKFTGVSLSSNAYLDIQWYMFSLIFLLGAAAGLRQEVHVRVDVLYERISARARAWIDIAGSVFFLLPFCVVMLVTSWPAVYNSWIVREGSPDPGGLIRYPIKSVLLICFVLLFLQGCSQIITRIGIIRGVVEDERPSGRAAAVHHAEAV